MKEYAYRKSNDASVALSDPNGVRYVEGNTVRVPTTDPAFPSGFVQLTLTDVAPVAYDLYDLVNDVTASPSPGYYLSAPTYALTPPVENDPGSQVIESKNWTVLPLADVRSRKLNDLEGKSTDVLNGGTVSDGNDVRTEDRWAIQYTTDFNSSQGKVPNNQALTYRDIRNGYYTRQKNVLDDLIGDVSVHRRLTLENEQVHADAINAETNAETLAAYDVSTGWPPNPAP